MDNSPRDRSQSRNDSPGSHPGGAFEHISSTANDTVKLLRSLDRKKERVETGLFLAEGARHAEEALANGWTPAYAFAAQQALDRPQTLELLLRMKEAGARVLTGTEKILVTLSRKDNPQTVITAFRQRVTNLADFPASGARRWLALYEVRDPGNLGTIIRTADAAGCDGVILLNQTCDPFSAEAVRASMGSLFAMRLAATSFQDFNAWRTGVGARMIAASMRGDRAHDKATHGERSVVLMGNEQAGLPSEVEDQCDELVRIPMMGKADSLNLATAASVMIYEAWRAQGYKGANR